MGEAKDHHFVPRGYLRGFANGEGDGAYVYVHERGSDKAYRKGVKNIAFNKNYYTVNDENDVPNLDVEKMLSRIESDALLVLRRLVEQDEYQPGKLDRRKLALFIGFQEVRVPWARDDAEKSFGELRKKQIGQFLKQNPDLLPDVSADIRERVIRGEGYDVVVEPLHSLQVILQIGPVLASWYELFKWRLKKGPSDESIATSDNPVIKEALGDSTFGLGVMNPDIQVTFPLSSSALLVLNHDLDREHEYARLMETDQQEKAREFIKQIPAVERTEINAAEVKAMNSLIAQYADESVYSRTEQPWLFELLKLPAGGNRTRIS